MRIDANKIELFAFLVKFQIGGSGILQYRILSEEADTLMFVHVANAYKKILIPSVDTDVVVLAVATAAKFDLEELWIAFGTGKNFRHIPAHEIARSFGPIKSTALPATLGMTLFPLVKSQHGQPG